jgi:2-amino-4-hydroxy-6-hydroxymethyldihydropteridine diphosphokinase
MTQTVFIGLGANLGQAKATLRAAAQSLATMSDVMQARGSKLYASAPLQATGPEFVNAVMSVETSLSPEQVLFRLQSIELAHGRERPFPNAPRTLDLDLLLHGDHICQTATLQLPHPRLHQRAFVLLPLLELAPELSAPGLGRLASHLVLVQNQAIRRLDEELLA